MLSTWQNKQAHLTRLSRALDKVSVLLDGSLSFRCYCFLHSTFLHGKPHSAGSVQKRTAKLHICTAILFVGGLASELCWPSAG